MWPRAKDYNNNIEFVVKILLDTYWRRHHAINLILHLASYMYMSCRGYKKGHFTKTDFCRGKGSWECTKKLHQEKSAPLRYSKMPIDAIMSCPITNNSYQEFVHLCMCWFSYTSASNWENVLYTCQSRARGNFYTCLFLGYGEGDQDLEYIHEFVLLGAAGLSTAQEVGEVG